MPSHNKKAPATQWDNWVEAEVSALRQAAPSTARAQREQRLTEVRGLLADIAGSRDNDKPTKLKEELLQRKIFGD